MAQIIFINDDGQIYRSLVQKLAQNLLSLFTFCLKFVKNISSQLNRTSKAIDFFNILRYCSNRKKLKVKGR
jgi:hypothetical protein